MRHDQYEKENNYQHKSNLKKKIISGFEDIIINHFRLKKTIILHQVSIWAEEATCRWSAKLKAHHKKLVILLNALDNIL